MNQEFPKLELTSERKEIMERELPQLLKRAGQHAFFRLIEDFTRFYEVSGHDPDVYQTILDLQSINWDEAIGRIIHFKTEGKTLEAVTLLDFSVGQIEQSIVELETLQNLQEEDDLEEQAEAVEDFETIMKKMADYRDWLLEEEPELQGNYTKDDFEKWLKSTIRRYESLLGEMKQRGDNEPPRQLLARYMACERVLVGKVLLPDEKYQVLKALRIEILGRRIEATHELTGCLLGERGQYDRKALLEVEKEIIKFRQFISSVEGEEWVKTKKI